MRDVSAIHFDERDDAEAFVDVLTEQGVSARLLREEFAGEDDAEDAAWVVEVASVVPGLQEQAERAGGWIPEVDPPAAVPPAPLPAAPKRLKRQER